MLLRKIARRAIWLEATDPPWVSAGDVCGDVLRDLKTDKGSLSVWQVDDSNKDRVIAAVAATGKKSIENFDMVLFSEDLLATVGVRTQQIRGNTPDTGANESWHLDIVELTAAKIAELASALRERGTLDRRRKPEVKEVLKSSLESKKLDEARLDPELLEKINS